MCSIFEMYSGAIKMMSNHRQPCRRVDNNAESNIASNVLLPYGNERTFVLCGYKKSNGCLDSVKQDNIEDVPVVIDSVVQTPLFDPTKENAVNAGDSKEKQT